MKWLTDFLATLFGARFPATEVPAALPSDEAVDFPFTLDEMRAIVMAAGCSLARADAVAIALTKAFIRFGPSNSLPVAHIVAHAAVESGGFSRTRENLNYSSVARIREVFGGNRGIARLTDAEVARLVNQPEALADIVYADSNRAPGYKLGNFLEGDGWAFRGHWWPQLTGRDTITAFAQYVGMRLSDVMQRDDAEINALATLWFATVYKKGIVEAALRDDLVTTTRLWNGGQNGLDDRRARLNRVKQTMKV